MLMRFTHFLRYSLLAALAIMLTGCGYNALQSQDEEIKASWAEVLNQYQRRADLVPNLVNVVKGYAAHEKDVLTEVTDARSRVGSIQATPDLVNDEEAFKKFIAAQSQMTSALSRLMVVAENYPQLKADGMFRDLQAQLEGTENRITVARNRYIATVKDYNITVRSFPTNLTAMVFGLKTKPSFTVENEQAIAVPPQSRFWHAYCTSPPSSTSQPKIWPYLHLLRELIQRLKRLKRWVLNSIMLRNVLEFPVLLRHKPIVSLRPVLLLALLQISSAWAFVDVPILSVRVTDLTHTLSPEQVQRLESKLADFEAKKGSQIAVLILPTTQPEDIAQFGIKVADLWRIGRKGVDDGLIFIIAKDDHQFRLEVGYGLEGVIPDAIAKRITSETVKPYFKTGDYFGGINAGIDQIMGVN